jgi:hypothetical protein
MKSEQAVLPNPCLEEEEEEDIYILQGFFVLYLLLFNCLCLLRPAVLILYTAEAHILLKDITTV